MDRERNVILDIGVEPTNINDVTPIVGILNETEERLGAPPGYWGWTRDTTTRGSRIRGAL